jgi:hypothetical protein
MGLGGVIGRGGVIARGDVIGVGERIPLSLYGSVIGPDGATGVCR